MQSFISLLKGVWIIFFFWEFFLNQSYKYRIGYCSFFPLEQDISIYRYTEPVPFSMSQKKPKYKKFELLV